LKFQGFIKQKVAWKKKILLKESSGLKKKELDWKRKL
ncbi:unnamed protein product, partial [marine sediment metagenome]